MSLKFGKAARVDDLVERHGQIMQYMESDEWSQRFAPLEDPNAPPKPPPRTEAFRSPPLPPPIDAGPVSTEAPPSPAPDPERKKRDAACGLGFALGLRESLTETAEYGWTCDVAGDRDRAAFITSWSHYSTVWTAVGRLHHVDGVERFRSECL